MEASKKRQAVVLGQMVKYGYITQEQADQARQSDLGLVAKQEQTHEKSNASYFINYVIAQVSEKYGDDAIYKDGLKIYTTLDMDAQNAAVLPLIRGFSLVFSARSPRHRISVRRASNFRAHGNLFLYVIPLGKKAPQAF